MATSTCFTVTKLLYLPSVSATYRTSDIAIATCNLGKQVGSACVKARFGSSKGGAGVLERPTFDQSQFGPITQVEQGGDIGQLRDKKHTGSGDSYRVLLVDDTRHTENLVAKVLPRVIPSVTMDDARRLFHESREHGVAVVVVAVKEHAEFYSQMMIGGGLRSTIEPDSSTAKRKKKNPT